MSQYERHTKQTRRLYALLFKNKHCYIGQTIDLNRRIKEHQNARGGWQGQKFEVLELGAMEGTRFEAEDYEFAWRYKASKAGWKIYGKPPNIVVNPYRMMNKKRHNIARGLKWPLKNYSYNRVTLTFVIAFVVLAFLMFNPF